MYGPIAARGGGAPPPPDTSTHALRSPLPPVRTQEVHLRKAANEDGEVRVVAPVTLASFLDTPQAQRMLSGRGARGRR